MLDTPVGTVQSQFPVEVNDSTVYAPLVEEVGAQAAALATLESATWLGSPTKSVRTNTHEIVDGKDC
ncbi:unannotated protein [freshwater metagenome]|uniref:Unannotated protein n=1 Tax=freshwater metagenome TaxID=449393 RepID=A0A6J5YNI8_9ZZZZ